jgi:DNA-binding GntR family transcriptional regulator
LSSIDFSQPLGPQVFSRLRDAIVTLKLLPGQRLSEAEIAKTMEVSRQPVRGAITRLAEVGLIRVLPQRGSYVVKISEQAVLDARFMRETLEVAIAKELAEQPVQGFFESIEKNLARQKTAAEAGDRDEFIKLDDYFHRSIAEAAGHLHAWRVVETEKAQMDRVRYLTYPSTPPMDAVVDQHSAIFRAIRSGIPEQVEDKMRLHLSNIVSSMAWAAENYPEYFVE